MTTKPSVRRIVATRDIQLAASYYQTEAGARIAIAFLEELEGAFRHIEAHAALGGLKYAQIADLQDLRFWPLRRYPYLIFYFERVDHIDVWRVLHASRDVPSWITSPTID